MSDKPNDHLHLSESFLDAIVEGLRERGLLAPELPLLNGPVTVTVGDDDGASLTEWARGLWAKSDGPKMGSSYKPASPWISVEERLPEPLQWVVWAFKHEKAGGNGQVRSYWTDNGKFKPDGSTHWMPLPDPPGD